MQEQLEVAAREWEARQITVQERYRVLLSEGLSKRDAIRRIKGESEGVLTATIIQSIVDSADPRKKQARVDRNSRILAMRQRGLKLREIAEQVGVKEDVVRAVLRERRKGDGESNRG